MTIDIVAWVHLTRAFRVFPLEKGASEALIEKVPRTIKTFAEAFQGLELRQKKAQLRTIRKAATVYKDGRIELEFRGESS
jgi:hypothetical protein